jgi:hypothetical protein
LHKTVFINLLSLDVKKCKVIRIYLNIKGKGIDIGNGKGKGKDKDKCKATQLQAWRVR